MKNTSPTKTEIAVENFARRIVARLDFGVANLPYDVVERLRAGRVQAVEQRKRQAAAVQPASVWSRLSSNMVLASQGGGGSGSGDDRPNWWLPLLSAVPVLALVAGLMVMGAAQEETGANEIAEVDAALLTDALPPAAYADPGFVQFLKTRSDGKH